MKKRDVCREHHTSLGGMSSWLSRREYIARLRKKGVENMHFPTFPMPMGIFPHKYGEYAPPVWGKVPTMVGKSLTYPAIHHVPHLTT